MSFAELKIKKLETTRIGTIYEGITHNFYELNKNFLTNEEFKFAKLLKIIVETNGAISELSLIEKLPDDFALNFRENILSSIDINELNKVLPDKKNNEYLKKSLNEMFKKIDFIKNKELFVDYFLARTIGLKKLYFFEMEDDFEELMVNGENSIFIYHKKYGMCKTNVSLDEKSLHTILGKISNSTGKSFSLTTPLMDSRLPNGYRVNATYESISPKFPTLTIRKFARIPLTILDLIETNCLTSEAAAFLWTMVDGIGIYPHNIIVCGGTATGKTVMLNTLSNFIRLNERIVTIEDTLELSLFERDNCIALESKHTTEMEVSMNDLIKNSLRMRPDRIIVGEVRGNDALTLFTAMDNGHRGTLGTLHADNSKEAIVKLQEKPFAIPPALISLVDIIIIMKKKHNKDKTIRYCSEITELSQMDGKVLMANLYEYDQNFEKLKRTDIPSHSIEKFSEQTSLTKNEIKKEIETRKMILDWMISRNIRKPEDILEFIQTYYYSPEKVLKVIYGN
ncbi:MAG: ATPase, T2SS/T4P/T4SS family [Candidatus ainarchaeum sp.]|nr:ATPase, T2SS/T4P/T4SS family [Candidatus ainarchaeum sp.]